MPAPVGKAPPIVDPALLALPKKADKVAPQETFALPGETGETDTAPREALSISGGGPAPAMTTETFLSLLDMAANEGDGTGQSSGTGGTGITQL